TNLTAVTEFYLLGFQGSQLLRNVLFLLFLAVYGATICGNFLIITLVSSNKTLRTPMYFFISQLSISDIILPTVIVPNLLHILLNNGGTITFIGCITQFYFFDASGGFEGLLLSVMSYDRYVAICNPLCYTSIMINEYCVKLAAMCWLLGNFVSLTVSITLSKLHFCGPNIIDHIYAMGAPAIIIATTIIIVFYTSHLIVISIFYWTMFSVYVIPKSGQTGVVNTFVSLLYTVFTPLINPIIYSLRNNEIKKAVQEIFHKHIS
ncbi:hypothetical protein GDO78_022971, partial [Eleutherodactylus coqui]